MQTLGTCRNQYIYKTNLATAASGKLIQRKHAHMHTEENAGTSAINAERVADLDVNYTAGWTPLEKDAEVLVNGPESILVEEIDTEFARLEEESDSISETADGHQSSVILEQVYDLSVLDAIRAGKITTPAIEEHVLTAQTGAPGSVWDPTFLLLTLGM